MSFASIQSATITGVTGRPARAEVHVGPGLPGFTIVGKSEAHCRESRDRIRAAILSSGLPWPNQRIVVNLADTQGATYSSRFDLPIALGILAASEAIPTPQVSPAAFGELGLDGSIRPVAGAFVLAQTLVSFTDCIFPAGNYPEAAAGGGMAISPAALLPAATLQAAIDIITTGLTSAEPPAVEPRAWEPESVDLADVGHVDRAALRALEIAAVGRHNLLITGPAGSGKTLIARRLAGILPAPSYRQYLDILRAHSAAGITPPGGWAEPRPPVRCPHHSSTMVAMVGGHTRDLRPGELSLASGGVLVLDDLNEFPPTVLDSLRQPLEEGWLRVARATQQTVLPADFLLVGTNRVCPCNQTPCVCPGASLARWTRRISGPLRDHFDLRITLDRPGNPLVDEPWPSTAHVAPRVQDAVVARPAIDDPTSDAEEPLHRALHEGRITARGLRKVIEVARTIAALDSDSAIGPAVVEEALDLRSPRKKATTS